MLEPDADGGVAPGSTGRTLVLLEEGAGKAAAKMLTDVAGVRSTTFAELGDEPQSLESLDSDGIVFSELDVAVLDAAPDQVEALGEAMVGGASVLAVEPERIVHALEAVTPDYLRGFRDAAITLSQLSDGTRTNGHIAPAPAAPAAAPAVDESRATWGLQAIGAVASAFSGKGTRVAVLDTGFDLQHPDFAGRKIVTRSFIPGEVVQDGHGHGTHCIGTACGSRVPGQPPRYGVAFDAQIRAGKVLSNRGSGTDTQILGGIEWALRERCEVISMSLGAAVGWGTPYSRVFEAVGQRALGRGVLIVAAAGNESQRDQGTVAPVGHPANCPSIMAVAATDAAGRIASFSCTSDPRGGAVDIAGPGVAVHSSWPVPRRYRTISGTSMATPHVAGAAALLVEARSVRGLALWGALTQTAQRLALPTVDVGSGLVQTP